MNNKNIERTCKKHGLTNFVLEGSGYYRCKKCRSEAVTRRRRRVKQKAVEHLGGKCVRCGYDKSIAALDFHHISNDKEFNISDNGNTRSWEKLKVELDKCVLVCSNCHREIHSEGYNDN